MSTMISNWPKNQSNYFTLAFGIQWRSIVPNTF